MVAVVKHIIVRAFDEVEHFHGSDLKAEVGADGCLYVRDEGAPYDVYMGIFKRWEYVREKE